MAGRYVDLASGERHSDTPATPHASHPILTWSQEKLGSQSHRHMCEQTVYNTLLPPNTGSQFPLNTGS